ncbi:preprotein translocase, SecY subunit [Thermodesulfatator indicus DSM 15286]|uniref:Protein translocase subunit SecY n=1 Tax=Thermodesulfatator indicus (strain DSM 15286 / JCM 11887 / CIR29812) TaxID=667014 RepID=F8AA57_THEID|nr:preprotein translocase subunit SecY [Thermodesulfatator indicus]AEH45345.1 preprotein translocase, SecY subunit [Thermodesulfatator indicus DSM 15286]
MLQSRGVETLANIPELRRRILFLLAALAIYRVAVQIPTPGINTLALAALFDRAGGTIFGFLDMFSGGALRRLSICALGIMPYISASIILQLLTVVFPSIKEMQKEGPEGRRKIAYYTRYLTVAICLIQGFGIAVGLERMTAPNGDPIVLFPGWGFKILTMITLTAGTIFLMWLGEQITEHGIGNGISMLIFAGIVAGIPGALIRTFRLVKTGELSPVVLILILALIIAVVAFTVFMERAQRRIPIHYARRQVGRQIVGGQTTYLPLKVNMAGVIPPIFASSVLMFPATIANFVPLEFFQKMTHWFQPGSLLYEILFVVLIIFFCYFYTAIIFNPQEVAENLQKQGGFIPGIRPGRATAEFLDKVLTRLTLIGALYISAICVLPTILIKEFNVPFYFGGTALLIVVGVAMDTMAQIEAHLLTRHYDGLMKQGRLRGRGR